MNDLNFGETRTYVIPKDGFSNYMLLTISIILILGVWIIILIFAKKYNPVDLGNTTAKTLPQNGGATGNLSNYYPTYYYLLCNPGECPTNISTGEKRCPNTVLKQMPYDPGYETCNPVNSCTSNKTPYAIKFDQSTNPLGVCDTEACRCVNYFATPSYTQTLFTVQGGSIYTNNPQLFNSWYLNQIPTSATGQGNNIPMQYQDYNNQFYEIAPTLLSRLVPNVCAEYFTEGPEIGLSDTIACVNKNPCLVGKMAYVQGYNEFISDFDYYKDPLNKSLACVPAIVENPADSTKLNECISTQAPVFNYITGKIFCVDPPAPEE